MQALRLGPNMAIGLLLLLSGCAYYDTPNGGKVLGTAPLTWTFPLDPTTSTSSLPAPRSLGAQATLPPAAANLSGSYSGVAIGTYNPGTALDCGDISINRSFVVTGRQVTFFAFNGTVGATGRVVMQAGDRWLSGRFIGRSFQGELLRKYPACSWNLNLTAN